MQSADFILPALENDAALAALLLFAKTHAIPLAYCPEAYAISSSKVKSDALFAQIGIPAPTPWPECGFPAIGKPDSASGSHGITIFHSEEEWKSYQNRSDSKADSKRAKTDPSHHGNHVENDAGTKTLPVMQQYIEGPSYSMEVMGLPGHYLPLETTELFMDEMYDCCRVTAPVALSHDLVAFSHDLVQQFEKISIDLAEAVNLKGIMDVEVILHDGKLKVLEIDARLPSQTPTAVYHATGINMVELLGEIFVHQRLPASPCLSTLPSHSPHSPKNLIRQHVLYEHISVTVSEEKGRNPITFAGEHIMSIGKPLFLKADFFGADEAITNHHADCSEFVATLIFTGHSPETVEAKRKACFHKIQHAEP
jgi:pyrrolysine biosynthesis protein PylC